MMTDLSSLVEHLKRVCSGEDVLTGSEDLSKYAQSKYPQFPGLSMRLF